jgi:hypothetical protein
MKTPFTLTAVLIIIAVLSIRGTIIEKQLPKGITDTLAIKYPAHVKAIMDHKCYDCHNSEAKSMKARKKLNLDSLSMISKKDQLSKLDKIVDVMGDGSMPPKKFLEKTPGAKLTVDETKAISEWAKKTSDTILK